MEGNEIQHSSTCRSAVLKTGVVTALTVAACVIGVPAASATDQPVCEQATISGDVTGTLGPFGPCVTNPGVPVNCVTIGPSLGTLVKVEVVLCTVD